MKGERLEKMLILIAIAQIMAVEKVANQISSKNRQKIAPLRLRSGQVFGQDQTPVPHNIEIISIRN